MLFGYIDVAHGIYGSQQVFFHRTRHRPTISNSGNSLPSKKCSSAPSLGKNDMLKAHRRRELLTKPNNAKPERQPLRALACFQRLQDGPNMSK